MTRLVCTVLLGVFFSLRAVLALDLQSSKNEPEGPIPVTIYGRNARSHGSLELALGPRLKLRTALSAPKFFRRYGQGTVIEQTDFEVTHAYRLSRQGLRLLVVENRRAGAIMDLWVERAPTTSVPASTSDALVVKLPWLEGLFSASDPAAVEAKLGRPTWTGTSKDGLSRWRYDGAPKAPLLVDFGADRRVARVISSIR